MRSNSAVSKPEFDVEKKSAKKAKIPSLSNGYKYYVILLCNILKAFIKTIVDIL